MSRDKNGVLKRSQYGSVKLYIPHEKWRNKLLELGAMKIVRDEGNNRNFWKPMHRGKLQNLTDVEIIRKFNGEIRGLYNFYRLASNVSVLNQFDYIMNGSLHKTLAFKYRTTASEIRKRYMINGIFGAYYQTKAGLKRCEIYHEGFLQVKIPYTGNVDTLPEYQRLPKRNSLTSRIKAGICELCGKEGVKIHMHHVRKLKDLKGDEDWIIKMHQIHRKSLALCPECFALINK